MSYLVLARKYRPQSFEEVVQQEHITRTLGNAIGSGRLAHAILFSGPRGTGKTTVARILAKAVNCQEGPTAQPCNRCLSCREITGGHAADVFEIDGASNNSVDQIRELRENVKYMPAHSPRKIYIIDEVHMLSLAAFNALLKTLEEPPDHVMFVFATTEPQKIPVTILSRCQRHDFRRIDLPSICGHMERICRAEKVAFDPESMRLIAREAGGSMRDALSLLDQVMTASDGPITAERVVDLLGVFDRRVIFDFSTALLRGDVGAMLNIIDDVHARGQDVRKLYADLIEHLRDLLIVRMGMAEGRLVDLPPHEIKLMDAQSKDVSELVLNQLLTSLLKESAAIRLANHPRLVLEMLCIGLSQMKPALPIETLIEKLDDLQKGVACDPAPKAAKAADRDATEMTGPAAPGPEAAAGSAAAPVVDGDDPERVWRQLQEMIASTAPALAPHLTKCTIKKMMPDSLEIEVHGNGFNVSMIQRQRNLNAIQQACRDFFGRDMTLHFTAAENSADDVPNRKQLADQARQEALNHPLVGDVVEIFDGKVVEVKVLQEEER